MSDSEVKIVINADDKASSKFKDLTKNLADAARAVSKVTDEYIQYGDQVKDLSSFTRISNEEASRLIQSTDDAFVSYNSLRLAMKTMADNGVQPTVEAMARLSDQFMAIKDPAAQAQFLIDQFGQRAGPDMAKYLELGGSKIREMAAATSESLIIDDEKAKKIQASKQALDEFNDSMTGMKYEAAGTLLGIFQQMPKPIQDVTLGIGSLVNGGALASMADLAIIFSKIGGSAGGLTAAGTALQGVAVGTWAVVGPALAVAAAIVAVGYAIYKLVEFFGMLGSMFNQLAANGGTWEFIKQLLFTPGALGDAIASTASWGNLLPGRASGGKVSAGRAYMVGENGPEPFIPGSDGMILPNGFSMAGGGAMVINNFSVNYSPFISTMDRLEAKTKFKPIFDDLFREKRA
jgi:hypothetical protein